MNSKNNSAVVRLDNIIKTYHLATLDVPVLKGVNMAVWPGEFVGIMGTSGSGKSTLLNILGLLDTPTDGKYQLDGQEVQSFSDSELAVIRNLKIGFIFQSFNLFPHLTVEQNIEVPMVYANMPKRERIQRARELGERVRLGHRLKHRPNELSGGECQRIAVARALGNRPSFLLADEPTGNLDEKTSNQVMEFFHELNRDAKMTIVMVTHNPALENTFHRVIHLRDGRVVDRNGDPIMGGHSSMENSFGGHN
ncbi:MAG: ABC transporter ATP-binding protein [Victivallaceae bacterium]|nr:ABC transporter ATP-binding protein [Victivallaceae bacterium]MDD5663932.1 ABC transporter ATP-binding protein [Victivallaceae bacterium]NLK83214.1 ABC transporter ATP-binding protein [Lentisphaerota bacterium]